MGVLAAAYIVLMLWITVLSRLDRAGDVMRYNLMPLWSIDSIKEGYVETLYEKVYNVLFFVPLGAVCAGFKIQVSSFKVKNPEKNLGTKILLFGMGVSVMIELLQLVTRTGMCETDDVLCNTTGFIIGYLLIRLLLHAMKILNAIRQLICYLFVPQRTDKSRYRDC